MKFAAQIGDLPIVLLLLLRHLDFGLGALLLEKLDLCHVLFNGLLFDGKEFAQGHLVFAEFFELLVPLLLDLFFFFFELGDRTLQIFGK